MKHGKSNIFLSCIVIILLIASMTFNYINYTELQSLRREIQVAEKDEDQGAEQDYGTHMLQIFKTCAVIGDSLSCGFTNYQDLSIKSEQGKELGQNWPSYLEERTGIRFNNLSIGGASAHEWRYQHIFSASEAADCFMVALGANDHRKNLEIGTASDIADNYEYNNDTFYGNMDFIVRSLHRFQETAPIFIFTMPDLENQVSGQHTDCNAYNKVIRYIAGTYDYVHLIDLYTEYGYAYESEVLTACFGNDHFTPLGYNYASDVIETALNQYIKEHYILFLTAPYKYN